MDPASIIGPKVRNFLSNEEPGSLLLGIFIRLRHLKDMKKNI
jgi:hypothetical protein